MVEVFPGLFSCILFIMRSETRTIHSAHSRDRVMQ